MSRILNMLNRLQARKTGEGRDEEGSSFASIGNPAGGGDVVSAAERYGLEGNPFSDSLNLKYYFQTATHRRVVMGLLDTISQGISLGLVTGPAGSGKTILTQLLLKELDGSGYRVILVLVTPKMSKGALLREILREAGAEHLPVRTSDMLDELHRLVMDLHKEGRRTVVLIDEAHFLSPEALHVLRTVSNLETPEVKLCTTILFGEENLLRRLGHPSYRSLATRMYHRLRLGPLAEEETDQYITFRLMVAGGRDSIFTGDARRAIHLRSEGICREINRLCHLALLEGALTDRERIGADVVEAL